MKKTEAISILATSVRPREAKDRERYDEAVGMAIEALKCSETPKSSERASETAQADHTADIGKKAEKEDCISRQAAIDALKDMYRAAEKWLRDATDDVTKARAESCMATLVEIKLRTEKLSAAQPEPCVNTIDALNESIKHFDDMAEECRRNANIERNDYMDMRDNAYEAQQLAQWLNELKYLREKIEQITIKTEPKWIPVSKETNPTKSGWYLVTVHEDATNENKRFTGVAEFNTTNGMWYDIDEPTDMYLRWMPLPEPYQGGEK